jgi:hypothetical protein
MHRLRRDSLHVFATPVDYWELRLLQATGLFIPFVDDIILRTTSIRLVIRELASTRQNCE